MLVMKFWSLFVTFFATHIRIFFEIFSSVLAQLFERDDTIGVFFDIVELQFAVAALVLTLEKVGVA